MVRVTPVQPDPDRRPVGPGVGTGRFAAGDQAGREDATDDDEDEDRSDPMRIAQAGRLAPKRAPEDAGSPAGRALDQVAPPSGREATAVAAQLPSLRFRLTV